MHLLQVLSDCFTRRARVEAGDLLLVAFSGGPDSTALLWGLTRLRPRLGIRLRAAHLDHALDPDSAARRDHAARLAERLDVGLRSERLPVARLRRDGESPEAAARRVRYDYLWRQAAELGARYLVTGHHRDDQIDTVLLRLLHGSGLEGLAAMRQVRGRLVRPCLGLSRRRLREGLAAAGLTPAADPANRDPGVPRNRVRALLRPELERRDPGAGQRLAALAAAATTASDRIRDRLDAWLEPSADADGVAVDIDRLTRLPRPLWPWALALLHRRAGAGYPASKAAASDLARQLAAGGRVGCDCGDGWRWRSRGPRLRLERARGEPETPRFAYTLRAPGELRLPEVGRRIRITRQPAEPWMFRGSRRKAGLKLEPGLAPGLTVRNRRPGDRIQPLGCPYTKRLKEVLIDRRVPRPDRDRLPLLCRGERILWIPGITIDESCRIERNHAVWVAEIIDE